MNNNLILFHKGNVDWQQAIRLGVELLVKNNIATNDLADAIIDSTKKLGPYYVIIDKVGLAHTTIGTYNKKIGLSLVVFENAIKFSNDNNKDVNLLFTLSAIDGNSHIDILKKFAEIFADDTIVEEIIKSKDINFIKSKLKDLFNF